LGACAAVWVDLRAVRAGLPGGRGAAAVGLVALLAGTVTVLRAAAVWQPDTRWRALLGAAARRTVRAPAGSLLLVCGVAVVALTALFVAPLAVPALGVLAAAALAVEERGRPG
ncbi:hypothetical protein OFY01_13295, partial [Streptomyces sp. GXMU-J5]|nr:hypothetical protein [Streptomyces beihaiensis]